MKHRAVLYLLLAGRVIPAAAEIAEPGGITQRRINEYAAGCVSAQAALSGLRGARRPGENSTQFHSRIHGYLASLDQLLKDLAPLRKPVALKSSTPENTQLWHRVAAAVNRLGIDVAAAHSAWDATPKLGERSRLGEKLLRALSTVQAILNSLRNARP